MSFPVSGGFDAQWAEAAAAGGKEFKYSLALVLGVGDDCFFANILALTVIQMQGFLEGTSICLPFLQN